MKRQPCEYQAICPHAESKQGCFEDVHHEYYPRRAYRTEVEREFRELDANKTRMCRWEHEDLHRYEAPPRKPTEEQMLRALGDLAIESEAS